MNLFYCSELFYPISDYLQLAVPLSLDPLPSVSLYQVVGDLYTYKHSKPTQEVPVETWHDLKNCFAVLLSNFVW